MKGIYKITNNIDNRIYIGSSINIKSRWLKHLNLLRNRKHPNIKINNFFNKYGETHISFEIVEEILNSGDLISREQYWIDLLKPEFNTCPKAGSSLGRQMSQENKDKMREFRKSKKHSNETKAKISESHKGKIKPYIKPGRQKLTIEDVIEILELLKVKKCSEISKIYKVNPSAISKIKKGRTWCKQLNFKSNQKILL